MIFILIELACFPIAFLMVIVAQHIDYKHMCKKYGEKEAYEIMRRF